MTGNRQLLQLYKEKQRVSIRYTLFLHALYDLLARCCVLYFFATAFDILAKTLEGVASRQADADTEYAHNGNDFFHDIFPFQFVWINAGTPPLFFSAEFLKMFQSLLAHALKQREPIGP